MLHGRMLVNESNRSVVLKRTSIVNIFGVEGLGFREDVLIRVKNHSHQIAITPRVGLGTFPTTASDEVRGMQIDPLAYTEITIPKEDEDGVLFTELYIFLDYLETLPAANNSRDPFSRDSLESPAGVEFTIVQSRHHRLFNFYRDGVTGAFSGL